MSTTRDRDESEMMLVDCDIHQTWKSPDEILDYLPTHYQKVGVDRGKKIQVPGHMYWNPVGAIRRDVSAEDGPPASSIANVREEHMEKYGVDYGILTGNILPLGTSPNEDYAFELAKAYNNWLIDKWLDEEGFLGSVVVAPQAPDRGAEMIRDLGTHPKMVQVLVNSTSEKPYGREYYWPIYEAATDVGLPVAIHPFRDGHGIASPPTGAGYPRTYFEWHTVLSCDFMGQLTSIVVEGVFEEFPDLKLVCIEGGVSWLPQLMWRMDKNWKALRSSAPWLERPPSEYILENVWLTTQPIEEPENPEHLLQIFDMIDAENTLMFSSDYPHWDGDSPQHGLPDMPEELERQIMYGNALEVYDLP